MQGERVVDEDVVAGGGRPFGDPNRGRDAAVVLGKKQRQLEPEGGVPAPSGAIVPAGASAPPP